MAIADPERRRLKLLSEIAKKVRFRTDVKVPLSDVHDEIVEHAGTFIARGAPESDTEASIKAYDLQSLRDEGWIQRVYLTYTPTEGGYHRPSNPAVHITPTGLTRALEEQKSWLSKSIDKQPMTFLQILLTVLMAIVTGVLGWALRGFYGC